MDLISSQYGWHDQYILRLPYARFRQITEVITERRRAQIEQLHSYAQIFYPWLVALATGKYRRLPDLFADVAEKPANEQFRSDLWWERPANN